MGCVQLWPSFVILLLLLLLRYFRLFHFVIFVFFLLFSFSQADIHSSTPDSQIIQSHMHAFMSLMGTAVGLAGDEEKFGRGERDPLLLRRFFFFFFSFFRTRYLISPRTRGGRARATYKSAATFFGRVKPTQRAGEPFFIIIIISKLPFSFFFFFPALLTKQLVRFELRHFSSPSSSFMAHHGRNSKYELYK